MIHSTQIEQGYDALPGATPLSLVATFDSYFSEIVRFFLSIHPERYTESDRQISLKELFTRRNLEEVIDQVIDIEIGELMRGSHIEQVKFVESPLEVKIMGHYERWPNFIEIFERCKKRACSDLTVRMMLVNLANSHKKMKNDPKCLEVISSIDWTASGDNFQICIASLKGDVDKVVALMPGLAASKAIEANAFREWPVLDWVRDDPKVNETFEHVYGEPIRNKVPEAVTTMKTSASQEPDTEIGGLSPAPEDATRH